MHPRASHKLCLAPLLLLLGLALPCLAPGAAQAQGSTWVSARSAARSWPLRQSDGELLRRSPLTQLLGVGAIWDPQDPAQGRLEVTLRLRLDTDLSLEPEQQRRLASQDQAFSTFHLQEAFVRARRLRGVVDLTLGRHLVLDPVTAQHMDGAQLALRLPGGAFVRSYGGALVTPGSDWATDASFGALWYDDRAAIYRDTPVVYGVGVGIDRPSLRLQLATRRAWSARLRHALEPPAHLAPDTAGNTLVLDDRLGASLHALPLPELTLEADLQHNPALDRLERGLAAVQWRWPWWELRTSARLEAWTPAFDLNSVFSVFGARPTSSALLGATTDTGLGAGRLLTRGSLGLTAYGDPDSQRVPAPWAHSEAQNLSARLGAGWRQPLVGQRWISGLRADLDLRAEDGWGGQLWMGSASTGARVLRDRFDLLLRGQLFHAAPDWQPQQTGTSAAGGLLADINLRPWGHLRAGAELRSTAGFYYALRLFALYTLDYELLQ